MAVYDENRKELASCIVSKAKYALGIKPTKPTNNKTCSPEYWERVISILAESNSRGKDQIAAAIMRYTELIHN